MIIIKNLNKKYKKDELVLKDFNLNVKKNERVLVKGNSGVGKTTLLKCIAGLEDYDGEITVDGSLAYIFQENRFMPWLTIKQCLMLPLKMKNMDTKQYEDSIIKMCKDLEVYEHLDKYPEEVSGGQLQRLSLVQGLVIEPDYIIMDEPLKSVEGPLYTKLYQYILNWSKNNKVGLIYVTHEQVNEKDFDNIINMT